MSIKNPSLDEELAVLEHTKTELAALCELALIISWKEVASALSLALVQTEHQLVRVRRDMIQALAETINNDVAAYRYPASPRR